MGGNKQVPNSFFGVTDFKNIPDNGPITPLPANNGTSCDAVDSINIEFKNFNGTNIDKLIVLTAPATLLTFTMCGGGAGPTMVLVGWIHFRPLKLTPANLTTGLPIGVEGIPISHFQRAWENEVGETALDLSTSRSVPCHPKVKFCRPITKFYLTMWGLDAAGEITTDPSLTVIASRDIEDIVTYPTPKRMPTGIGIPVAATIDTGGSALPVELIDNLGDPIDASNPLQTHNNP